MGVTNLPLLELIARRDRNSHACLEFYRGNKWSEYLAASPGGVRKFRVTTAKFLTQFDIKLDTPLERVALSLLRSHSSAYIPEDGVAEILLEIYTMTKANGTTDLTTLNAAALLSYHNELAAAVQQKPLASFKGAKSKLLGRIAVLQAAVSKPTTKQVAAKEASVAKASKRLEGLAALKESKQSDRKIPTKVKPVKDVAAVEAKKAVKKTDAAKAPRKQGIGTFCMDLIQKGKTNDQVLESVRAKFPDASTSASSIAWYRNKLKSDGLTA